jgi:hypothetical protein
LKVGLAAPCLYGLLVAVLFFAQRSLLYPAPQAALPPPAGFEQVTYTTYDGLTLKAAYRAAEDGKPTIVFFHGNADNWSGAATATQAMVDAGFGALLAEYRGYSGNPGKPSEQGLYRDGRAAIAWITGQGVGKDKLVLVGNSLGSGVAVELAVEASPLAIILISPYSSMTALVREKVPWVPVSLLIQDRFDSQAKLAAITSPILILHGSRDELIPVEHAGILASANERAELVTFADVGHELAYRPEAGTAQRNWLNNILAQ